VPIEQPRHRMDVRRVLEQMLEDNRQAWDMMPDGTYVQRVPAPGEDERGTHALLIERAR